MSRRSRTNQIVGNFVTHRREMRESPAWRCLPDDARRILFQLELEHMRHGGAENGSLICRHVDFQNEGGIRRNSIALALRQAVALGSVEITYHARPALAEHKRSSLYRLTYVFGSGKSPPPSDDWKRIETEDQAVQLLADAARIKSDEHVRRADPDRRKPKMLATRIAALSRI